MLRCGFVSGGYGSLLKEHMEERKLVHVKPKIRNLGQHVFAGDTPGLNTRMQNCLVLIVSDSGE